MRCEKNPNEWDKTERGAAGELKKPKWKDTRTSSRKNRSDGKNRREKTLRTAAEAL